jgi:hypothetical protein
MLWNMNPYILLMAEFSLDVAAQPLQALNIVLHNIME